jgi:hypothetical protein
MSERADAFERATEHIKRVFVIVGISADDETAEAVTSVFDDYIRHYMGHGDRVEDYLETSIVRIIFEQLLPKPQQGRLVDEERLKAKDKVRSLIRHTLQTDKSTFTLEQLKYIEDKVLQIFETIARAHPMDREQVYRDFEYYDLGLTESTGGASVSAAS